ncbi:MAG: glycosyltransferase family 4 protein [Bacteroidetes bacterium]|nr:glycosyltransferase family 4 protein [Bacteroidota bacterium]
MKIVFIQHDNYPYGATQSLLTLIDGLQKYYPEIQLEIIIPEDGYLEQIFKRKKIPIFSVFYPWWFVRANELTIRRRLSIIYHSARVAWILRTRLKKGSKPDFIVTNTSVVGVGIFLALFLYVKHVWYLREFGDIDHGLYPVLGKLQMVIGTRLSDTVIVNSNFLKKYVETKYFYGNSQVLYNGIREYPDESQEIFHDGAINYGIIGNISFNKGQKETLFAFKEVLAEIPNAKLWIIGGGDQTILTEMTIWESLKDNVIFTGMVANVNEYYYKLGVVIVASRYEAFGRVAVEGMMAGLPIIGRNTSGTAELIKDGETGFLFNSNTELKNKMILLGNDKELRIKLGQNAKAYARATFSIKKYATGFVNILSNK